MTLQNEQQIVTIHILPNILRSKGNQTTKLRQFIKFCVRNIFFSKIMQKLCRETSSKPLFVFFLKALYMVKPRGRQLHFKIFGRLGHKIKKLYDISHC